MESWSYISGGKEPASNETISSSDTVIRSKNAAVGWDLESRRSFGDNILVPGPATENRGFGELGYQELIGKQLPDGSTRYALSGKVDGGKIVNTGTASPNAFHLEDESTSRVSSTVVDSNCKSPSFIDLKLGRFGDPKDAQNARISKGTPIASSSESSTLPKKARAGVTSHTTYCQVYGCNKDLSGSKEYHKRHKVCEVHSKTAKVIVKGIEQRFCQQCSRFHLLAEFDDGKRSCRRRLAGHNERRRKTQVTVHSGRSGRLLQSYNGLDSSRYHGTAFSTASFICQDILPTGLLDPEKHIKLEDGVGLSPLSAFPIAIGNLHSKSPFPSGNLEKVYPKFLDGGTNTPTGSILRERTDACPPDWGGQTSSPRSLLLSTSFTNEDFTAFDTVSSIQGLSGFTDSGCALSLLSSQSQNSSSQSSGIPMAHQLVVPGGSVQYSMGQVSEKLVGVSPRASTTGVSKKFSSTIMCSAEGSQLGPILISDGSSSVNFDLTHGIFRGSDFVDAKDHLSCEDDTTIDLLQLSSQLQRVEHQKQSIQMQQENNSFCCSRIT